MKIPTRTWTVLFLFFLPLVSLRAGSGNDIFVDASVVGGTGSGSSWGNAHVFLQDALAAASAGDSIHVAEGAYYPDEGAGRTNNLTTETFTLPSGACLLGGYPAGGGPRDPDQFASILSGDLTKTRDTDADGIVDVLNFAPGTTASTVLTVATEGADVTLDGIVITGGGQRGLYSFRTGATFHQCRFIGNTGRGGAFLDDRIDPDLDVVCTFCEFIGNGNAEANSGGGGLQVVGMNVTLDDSLFENNQVFTSVGGGLRYEMSAGGTRFARLRIQRCSFKGNRGINGGGLHVAGAVNSFIANSLVSGNRAGNPGVNSTGGGLHFTSVPVNPSSPSAPVTGPTTLSGCTVAFNTCATGGGGVYFGVSSGKTISNCLVTGNLVASDSTDPISNILVATGSPPSYRATYAAGLDLEVSFPGEGNFNFFLDPGPIFEQGITLTQDPANSSPSFPFYQPTTAGDLRQTAASPLVDAGRNDFSTQDLDLLRQDRVQNGTVDVGAYEFGLEASDDITITALIRLANGLRVEFDSSGPVDVYLTTNLTSYDLLISGVEDSFSHAFGAPKRFYILVPAGADPPSP